ncbi:hypothetical protein HQ587_00045 [bacterium]|nr:hypothetical protein [bacterium]
MYLNKLALIFTVLLAVFLIFGSVLAQDEPVQKDHKCCQKDTTVKACKNISACEGEDSAVSEFFSLTGMNYCVSCGLKEAYDAPANCRIYGHQHALNVSKYLTPCGKERSDCVGMTLYYLANDKSKELREGLHHETVTVKGKIYWKQSMIEVEEFEVVKTEAD